MMRVLKRKASGGREGRKTRSGKARKPPTLWCMRAALSQDAKECCGATQHAKTDAVGRDTGYEFHSNCEPTNLGQGGSETKMVAT